MATLPINMIVLADGDNVGIALRDIASGDCARAKHGAQLVVAEPIPQGHKIALTSLGVGERVVRYSMPVATVTEAVSPGELVHVHNVMSNYLNNDHDHYE